MIDWTKDVQMSCQERDMWEDFVPLFTNKDHVYGYTVRDGVEHALVWYFTNFQFRNKPAEPKRVIGWLCLMKHTDAGTYHIGSFLHDTYESAREYINAEHPYATCVAVFEIDVSEGHGLEERK